MFQIQKIQFSINIYRILFYCSFFFIQSSSQIKIKVLMFNKKASRRQSTSQLMNILTRRGGSRKNINSQKGIYNQWPGQQKPSLLNPMPNYFKFLQQQQNSNTNTSITNTRPSSINRKENQKIFQRQAATMSTCQTMQFFPAQNSVKANKFIGGITQANNISAMKTKNKNQKPLQKKLTISSNNHSNKATPIITKQRLQHPFSCNDKNNDQSNSDDSNRDWAELNSRYQVHTSSGNRRTNNRITVQINSTTPKNQLYQNRRFVRTAKIGRKVYEIEKQNFNDTANNSSSIGSKHSYQNRSSIRPKIPSGMYRTGGNITHVEKREPFASIDPKLSGSTLNNDHQNCKSRDELTKIMEDGYSYPIIQPPMRLKDYQSNFQAFKVISQIIDDEMRWQPKKRRPKSSVSFRKYKV